MCRTYNGFTPYHPLPPVKSGELEILRTGVTGITRFLGVCCGNVQSSSPPFCHVKYKNVDDEIKLARSLTTTLTLVGPP